MELTLRRIFKGSKYTIGKLYIDNEYICDTIEDVDRGLKQSTPLSDIAKIKVPNETAIPTGRYRITMDVVSPKYSNFARYPWAKFTGGKLPRLINVPGFDGVLIHVGNTLDHSSGCILVGYNKVKGKVINSTEAFNKLYPRLNTNDIFITIS